MKIRKEKRREVHISDVNHLWAGREMLLLATTQLLLEKEEK